MTFPANGTDSGRHPPNHPLPGARAFRGRILPTTRGLSSSLARAFTQAFTLIELLVVMAIVGILLAAAIPAIQGLTGSTALSIATRQVSNLVTLARTEAIARNTLTRLAIAREWPDDPELSCRKVSIWAWDRSATAGSAGSARSSSVTGGGRMNSTSRGSETEGAFVMVSDWETLPSGVAFETISPMYIKDTSYAYDDPSSVRVDHFLSDDGSDNLFSSKIYGGLTVDMDYFEFRPNGAARLPGGNERAIGFVLTEGFRPDGADSELVYTNQNDGAPRNWAQINISNLTGRVKIYRP